MTPQEFVDRAVGVPWVRWRSDWEAMDCFGLLILFHREVLGVDLGTVPHVDIKDGFAKATGWVETEDGATAWMAFKGDSAVHCGVLLPSGACLHSEGSANQPGSVRVTPLRTIKRVFGQVKTFRYAGHP